MMIEPTTPPQDVVNAGVFGGHWFLASVPGCKAFIFWKGGPGSVDHDAIIHWMESEVRNQGYGTRLIAEIFEWADLQSLDLTAVIEPGQLDWWQRRGFIAMQQYREFLQVFRRAKRESLPHPLTGDPQHN